MKKFLPLAIAVFLLSSCAPKALYNWNGYDSAVYNYTKSSNEKSLQQLMATYDILMKDLGTSNRPAPGICADYGYLLIKKGEVQKGKKLLQQEIAFYPESAVFINQIIKRTEK